MKKLKKLISLVVAATFLLSLATPAFASSIVDSIGRLNSLGVVKGYSADASDFKPEQNITRAEFAAVAVRLLGLEAAENAAKGATKFKDVKSADWHSGYVNLAVGNGIIKGYPDGTFKPEKNVTNAEAFAMLVRVLGYEPVTQGVWPTNYIGKASQLSLLDGVSFADYNEPATRGNVFLASDNALDVEILVETGYDSAGKITYGTVKDDILLKKRLSVTKGTEGEVITVPNLTNGTKDKLTIRHKNSLDSNVDTPYDTISTFDPNPYLGLKVVPWVKDKKVFFLDIKTSSSDIITDSIKAIDGVEKNAASPAPETATKQTLSAGRKFTVSKLDKEYIVADSPNVYFNYGDAATKIGVGNSVKVILDANGKAKTIIATSYTARLVESVDATNEKITFKGDGAQGGSIELKNKTYSILKDGKTIKLADIKVGNVVDYYSNGDKFYVVVTDSSVAGKLTAIAEDGTNASNNKKFKVTIGGKEYKLIGSAGSAYFSIDDGKKYEAINTTTDAGSVLNVDVKALLNRSGSVAYIVAGSAGASGEFIALVKYTKVVDLGEKKRYIYVTKADGTNTYFEITKNTKINNVAVHEPTLKANDATTTTNPYFTATTKDGVAVVGDEIVRISLTSDGKAVDNIRKFNDKDVINGAPVKGAYAAGPDLVQFGAYPFNGGITQAISVDKNADSVKIAAYSSFAVNSDTKIFKVTTANEAVGLNGPFIDDAEVVNWSAIEAIKSDKVGSVWALGVTDGGVAKALVIYNIDSNLKLASDFRYGALSETGYDGKSYLRVNEGSASETVKKEGSTNAAVEDIVRFKISADDKFAEVTPLTWEGTGNSTYNVYKVKKVNSSNKQLELVLSDENGNELTNGATVYKFYDPTKVKVFDVSGTNSVVYVSDVNSITGNVVKIYNAYDKDGKDLTEGGDTSDQVYDFITILKK
ncbi:MAG: S-layer homology domain-containing protein [Clostridia bacterium]|nr:S-layer homology domain-containing protein [Clostridia bacterium]